MNILLLSPEFPDTFWSFKHALKFIGRKASFPPLGLLTVAAMLPSGWSKRLVDMNVGSLTDADLRWADYAFVGAMVVQRDTARRVIARCRAAGVPVVAGGPLFTIEQTEFPEVDHLVLNEAEITLPPFLRDLEHGTPQRLYDTAERADLTLTPAPLWELVDFRRYASMSVQFCRGCPYDCDFCNVTALLGHRPRTKSVAQIINELRILHESGWRDGVFFVDDNLIGNKRFLKTSLLPALIDWQQSGKRVPFSSQVSLNLADDTELMRLMSEAGFDAVFIGIETSDESTLEQCNKKQNLGRDMVQDVRRIQSAGIEVKAGFIVGFDGDTAASIQRQGDFIQRSGITTAMVGLLQAPPGTRLFDRMKAAGRLAGGMSGDNVDGSTNILPISSMDTLREQYRALLLRIYSPSQYYARVRTFLHSFRPPRVKRRLRAGDLVAFLQASLRLGVLGRERWHYWRLLAWTALFRPRLVSRMVTLAIQGYHFRRVVELHVT
jgi:radical SAM superfamily enzyme YgiQ (UPF0313 family)